jgi:hypothetical protein
MRRRELGIENGSDNQVACEENSGEIQKQMNMQYYGGYWTEGWGLT